MDFLHSCLNEEGNEAVLGQPKLSEGTMAHPGPAPALHPNNCPDAMPTGQACVLCHYKCDLLNNDTVTAGQGQPPICPVKPPHI